MPKSISPRRDRLDRRSRLSDVDVADIGEALRTQQLLGDILRRNADVGSLGQPDGGRLEGCVRGQRTAGRNKASRRLVDAWSESGGGSA